MYQFFQCRAGLFSACRGKYQYTADLLLLASFCRSSGKPEWSEPLLQYQLEALLCHDPDSTFVSFIMKGLIEGFPIGFEDLRCRQRSVARNHPSSLRNGAVVSSYIQKEVSLGRLVGPISQDGIHTSTIGLIPKARQVGKWRMIVDLYYPAGGSVNDGISRTLSSVRYASVDNAMEIFRSLGPRAVLTKFDLQDAYRIVPVHPAHHHRLEIVWEGRTYVDRCLPFGLRSAPKIFSAISDALAWIFASFGLVSQVHYLDDFLFLAFQLRWRIWGRLGSDIVVQYSGHPSSYS